ncbi:MAG: thrombospondin type 3 repeat-containing protein, partial [Pseudomonadales bacterium]|nr:thrombospondin type 3 repeat-containing protein [Pseudomonadales bacterium]
ISEAPASIYATPLTTMALHLARMKGDSSVAPYAGNGDGTLDLQEFEAAVPVATAQVLSTVGFGMDTSTDIFTTPPLFTAETTSIESQQSVIGYRQAIEAFTAVMMKVKENALANDPTSQLTVDEILDGLGQDLQDGALDGKVDGQPILLFDPVTGLAQILETDPATLDVPGTETPVSDIRDLLIDEKAVTNVEVDSHDIDLTAPLLASVLLNSDIDHDGVPDYQDSFPEDPNEQYDLDMDGIGDNADNDVDGDGVNDDEDAFPLDASESSDLDQDGIGDNSDDDIDGDGYPNAQDRFPEDPSEWVDTDNDGIGDNSDEDADGDGVPDAQVLAEPIFIPVGPKMDRISLAPPPPNPSVGCDGQVFVVVSGTQTTLSNVDGTCRKDLPFTSDSGNLGAILMRDGEDERLLTYSIYGTTIGVPEPGYFSRFFGTLFGGPYATTDAQYAVSDAGEPDYSKAYTVYDGDIFEYTLDPAETAIENKVFDTWSVISKSFISFAPISSTQGVAVTGGTNGQAFLVDLPTESATLIGDVEDDALSVRCASFGPQSVGCAIAYHQLAHLGVIFGVNGIFEQGPTLEGISTASPNVSVNREGELVVATVNDTDGQIALSAVDPVTGVVVQATYFLSDFFSLGLESAIGVSAILIAPEPHIPDGAIAISTDREGTDEDGVVVVPITSESTFAFHYWFN